MITEEQIKRGLDKAYKEAGHNAYFANGFEAGVRFAEQQLKNCNLQNVTTRYTVVYVDGNRRNMQTIEFDAINDKDALGQFCLKVPTGRWIQVRES